MLSGRLQFLAPLHAVPGKNAPPLLFRSLLLGKLPVFLNQRSQAYFLLVSKRLLPSQHVYFTSQIVQSLESHPILAVLRFGYRARVVTGNDILAEILRALYRFGELLQLDWSQLCRNLDPLSNARLKVYGVARIPRGELSTVDRSPWAVPAVKCPV